MYECFFLFLAHLNLGCKRLFSTFVDFLSYYMYFFRLLAVFISFHFMFICFGFASHCFVFFALAWCVLLSARPQSVFDLDSSVWWVCNHRIHHHTTHHRILYANAILNSSCLRCFNCCLLVFFLLFFMLFFQASICCSCFSFSLLFSSILSLRFNITKSPFFSDAKQIACVLCEYLHISWE